MTLAEKIYQEVQKLPTPTQTEILDFVEFLRMKKMGPNSEAEWKKFSLNSAMRGMEHESSEYSTQDLKEKF